MIILNSWYGQLGNNIIQLANIIHIAITYKHNIKINVKKPDIFDLSVIEEYFNKYNNSEIITDNNNFFYSNNLPFSTIIFKQNVEERNEILKKVFLIKNINKLNENELVIHIRSGDIFISHPHPNYVPPPLSYYIKEIDKCKYEKIHIICEDTKNPVVNELLKLYKNSVYEKNNLEKDIRIILGATNIMFSIGTFIPSLLLMSNNIKFIHRPFKDERQHQIFFPSIVLSSNNIEVIDSSFEYKTQKYYKIMRPWKNTIEQRNYILTYDCN
jgi:hypothetical protein